MSKSKRDHRPSAAVQSGALSKPRFSSAPRLAGFALLAVVTVLAYWPSLSGDFLLDDNGLLTHNKLVHAPDGLARIWFSTDAPDYWPVTNSMFWLEWRLWGLHPTGYHVTNLTLHIAAAFLLWSILQTLSIPGAFLGALLFAVHPVNVESVAWISQLKNTLAMVFFLAAIGCYLRAEECRNTRRWYWLSLLTFILAMLSKGSVAILPVILLSLMWWQRRQIFKSDLLRIAPFFAIAIAFTAVNLWFQTHGKEIVLREATFPQRAAGAGSVVWFYLAKALVPIDLVFIYPNWHIQAEELLWWLPLAAAIAFTATLWLNRNHFGAKSSLSLLFAWGLFCIALLPVLGFNDVGFMKHSLVADHYQHIALLVVAALVAAAWATWRQAAHGVLRNIASAAAIVAVGALTYLTWNQNHLYGDPITLYTATLSENPDCWLAHYNLGNSLTMVGRPADAIPHYQKSLQLKPDDAEVLTNLGIALGALGRTQEGFDYLQQALRLKPEYAPAESNLGLALVNAGRPQEGIEHLQHALELDPEYADAALNLGGAYLGVGQTNKAVECFQRALELKPQYAEAFYNLGNVAVAAGQSEKAIRYYQQALEIKPNYADAHNNLGGALLQAGRPQEAIQQYRQALAIRPNDVGALYNLALAYAAMQQSAEAIAAAEKAASVAHAQNQPALAKQIEEWLAKFRAAK